MTSKKTKARASSPPHSLKNVHERLTAFHNTYLSTCISAVGKIFRFSENISGRAPLCSLLTFAILPIFQRRSLEIDHPSTTENWFFPEFDDVARQCIAPLRFIPIRSFCSIAASH